MRILLLPVLLLLTSCGFQPMYGSHSASADLKSEAGASLANVDIQVLPDREGQMLRNELIDGMYPHGQPATPRYQLKFNELVMNVRELDLTKSSEATRAQIIASTGIHLIDMDSGNEVLSRSIKSISSYNVLPSEFATNVTEENARESAIKDLARQVQLQLTLYFNRDHSANETPDQTN